VYGCVGGCVFVCVCECACVRSDECTCMNITLLSQDVLTSSIASNSLSEIEVSTVLVLLS
jgi:hypothetical protein